VGTWFVDSFGNDDACDWADGLEEVHDLSLIEDTLNAVLAFGNEYIEAPESTAAIAAIEVLARLQGNWGERSAYSMSVDMWVEEHKLQPSSALVQKAHLVIERILSDNSELNELWQEGEDYQAWLAAVAELKGRIKVY
jgi:hypothetical protein